MIKLLFIVARYSIIALSLLMTTHSILAQTVFESPVNSGRPRCCPPAPPSSMNVNVFAAPSHPHPPSVPYRFTDHHPEGVIRYFIQGGDTFNVPHNELLQEFNYLEAVEQVFRIYERDFPVVFQRANDLNDATLIFRHQIDPSEDDPEAAVDTALAGNGQPAIITFYPRAWGRNLNTDWARQIMREAFNQRPAEFLLTDARLGIAHELGHVLGLAHPHGIDAIPTVRAFTATALRNINAAVPPIMENHRAVYFRQLRALYPNRLLTREDIRPAHRELLAVTGVNRCMPHAHDEALFSIRSMDVNKANCLKYLNNFKPSYLEAILESPAVNYFVAAITFTWLRMSY